MGNSSSRFVGCFVPFNPKGGEGVDIELFLEPLDEGLGHSFCYVRPFAFDSPAITPSNSERFTADSSTLDSETLCGSFRDDATEDSLGLGGGKVIKNFPETTFKTISGASVSANVSTARTGDQTALFASDAQEPAASFESTSSFSVIPLQPVPHGSGPLNGFMSGPLERGFASGPLDKAGGGFMSGPIEKGVMSGPLDVVAGKSNFSAPLARARRRPGLKRLMRSVSGPMKSTLTHSFARHSMGSSWMRQFSLHPVTKYAWHHKETKSRSDASQNSVQWVPVEGEYRKAHNLQWAHGKAGEDRVHVVLSEEQGWLFMGIYDGFSGPDAPDFLMSHLYRAIDKELEGLLWYYKEKCLHNLAVFEPPQTRNTETDSDCRKEDHLVPEENSGSSGIFQNQSSDCGIVEEKDRRKWGCIELQSLSCQKASISDIESICLPIVKLTGQVQKRERLYELLQMEPWDGQGSLVASGNGPQISHSCDFHPNPDVLSSRGIFQEEELISCSLNQKGESLIHSIEGHSISGDDGRARDESDNQTITESLPVSALRQSNRKSLISSNIRQMYQKQKSLRKKLFPSRYDWHREESLVSERMAPEPLGPIRRCTSGSIDHDAVLRAMARALETTEEAYMEMVEQALDQTPELALMGSCVLVMLMKDQDVYVMNLGDSRVILAQERLNDCHPDPNLVKDNMRLRSRSRESLVRMELDRISEESPIHNPKSQVNEVNKNKEISICRTKMRAVQLSTDHSTSVEEEIIRVKAEHVDDCQAIMNNRVKGQLKVTRAFGAGFLKKPTCNADLLEMFRIDYVGTAPYISCIPSILHYRLSSSDRFMVLSSDGLYQYFSNEEVVAHVTWFMEKVPEGDPAQYLIAELLFRAAKKNGMEFHELLDIPHGDRRKYHDDVSVMVVSLEGRIWRSSG